MTDHEQDTISRKAAIEAVEANRHISPDQAIRAIAALPSVGVKVKQLEWVSMTITKEHKGLSGIWLHAWGVNGQYEVHVFDTDPGHVMLNGPDIVPTDIYDTLEAAKAAAQADYEARILAEFDVHPAPDVAPDVETVRARVAAAIFDPGATEGYKGDRSLTQWQTDAVMRALIKAPPALSPDVAAKLKAAEDYANEITPNGSRRIENITGLLSDKQADHIRTQIDLAFKAGWYSALARKGGDA